MNLALSREVSRNGQRKRAIYIVTTLFVSVYTRMTVNVRPYTCALYVFIALFLKDLLWFSVACFWCRSFGDFHLMFVHITFSSVCDAEWPSFGKELLTRLTICSLCILTICN